MNMLFNIGRNDAAINTCAPFMAGSMMRLGDSLLPSGMFVSIKIYCRGGYKLPIRLSGASRNIDNTGTLLHFSDKTGKAAGDALVMPKANNMAYDDLCTCFIVDTHDNIVGHVAYRALLGDMAWTATHDDDVVTDESDFRLLPQCHAAILEGGIRHIQINNNIIRGTVHVMPSSYVYTNVVTDSYTTSLQYSVCGPYGDDAAAVVNGICHITATPIKVNGATTTGEKDIWVGGCNLVIRAGVTSNLRIIADTNGISIRSVLDG